MRPPRRLCATLRGDAMARRAESPPLDYGRALIEAFAVNERINQLTLDNLDDAGWRAEPPLKKGRDVAAIVAHVHNVRHMWLVVSGKGLDIEIADKLDRLVCTKAQAKKALSASARAMTGLLERAVADP